jgi:hypothetical protein
MSNTAENNENQNGDEVEVKPPKGKPSQAEGDVGDSDQG